MSAVFCCCVCLCLCLWLICKQQTIDSVEQANQCKVATNFKVTIEIPFSEQFEVLWRLNKCLKASFWPFYHEVTENRNRIVVLCDSEFRFCWWNFISIAFFLFLLVTLCCFCWWHLIDPAAIYTHSIHALMERLTDITRCRTIKKKATSIRVYCLQQRKRISWPTTATNKTKNAKAF